MRVTAGIECAVIGANGLIGRRIGGLLGEKGIKWAGTRNKRPEGEILKLDITDSFETKRTLSALSPKAVFHCANLAGGVDFCEANPNIAAEFHLNAAKAVAQQCAALDAAMVFISTDYVFDGRKDFYSEGDAPNPLNLYGALKLEAERWISANLKKHLIIRTTNVYGWDPATITPNYVMNLYHALKDNRTFNAPSFLWGTPTYVGDLAEAIVELYLKGACGIFHVVGSSFVNRLQWAIEAAAVLGLDASLIKEAGSPPAKMVPRPLKSRLDANKFKSSYKAVLRDVSSGTKLMKEEMGF